MSGPMTGQPRRARRWSPAMKRYQGRFWIAMAIYIASLAGVIWVMTTLKPAAPLSWVVAVLPSLPIIAVVGLVGRYLVEEDDEFLRRLFIESILWGLAGLLAVTTVWGFLETVGAPRVRLYWIFPMLCACMAVSQPFILWRYR